MQDAVGSLIITYCKFIEESCSEIILKIGYDLIELWT